MDLLDIKNNLNQLIFKGGLLFCLFSSFYETFEIPTGAVKPVKSLSDELLDLAKGGSRPGSPTRGSASGYESPKSEGHSRSNSPARGNANDSFTTEEVEKVIAENHRFGQLIMKYFYEEFLRDYNKQANELKSINDLPMKIGLEVPANNKIKTSKEELRSELINMCMFHAETMIKAYELRLEFISRVDGFLPEDERKFVSECVDKILEYRAEYANKIESIKGSGSSEIKPLIKQFFDNTN